MGSLPMGVSNKTIIIYDRFTRVVALTVHIDQERQIDEPSFQPQAGQDRLIMEREDYDRAVQVCGSVQNFIDGLGRWPS